MKTSGSRTRPSGIGIRTRKSDHLEHIKREPFLAYRRAGRRRLGALARVAPDGDVRAQEPAAETASSMKPYVETIPGTDVKFEMVPIPGGTFTMGSPPEEAKLEKDDDPLIKVAPGPQHPVQIAPFWMGKYEVTWDEYDQFAFSLDLKKKSREKSISPSSPRPRRRPTP